MWKWSPTKRCSLYMYIHIHVICLYTHLCDISIAQFLMSTADAPIASGLLLVPFRLQGHTWSVRRRYNDFVELERRLSQDRSLAERAPLPGKDIFGIILTPIEISAGHNRGIGRAMELPYRALINTSLLIIIHS